MAARMGTLTMSVPAQPSLSLGATATGPERSLNGRPAARPATSTVAPGARPQAARAPATRPSAATCSEILLRAQLGELTAQAKEQLQLCR